MKIKTIAMLLLAIMLLSMLAACKTPSTEDNPDGETTIPDETTPVVEDAGKTLIFHGREKSEYKLISGENVSNDIESRFTFFKSRLKNKLNPYYTESDDVYPDNFDISATKEILFGPVNRDECREIYDQLNYDGYAVKKVGNKIVIAAYTVTNMADAIDAFFKQCTVMEENEDGTKSLYYVKDVMDVGKTPLMFDSKEVAESCKIVYSNESKNVAVSLATKIKKIFGISLPLVSDSSAESEYEIIVGNTKRSESAQVKPMNRYAYAVQNIGKKVVIVYGANAQPDEAIDVFFDKCLLSSPTFNLPPSINLSDAIYDGVDRDVLSDGANVRIMSFNILNEEWASNPDLTPRISGVTNCILYYMPDVIGIQEVSPKWYAVLREKLGHIYEFINPDILGGKDYNYTGLAYNKNTVNLIESDLMFYSVYNSKRIRLVNAGLFELKDSGIKFVTTSTHFNANHDDRDHTPERTTQATEFIERIKQYVAKYDCPIFATGDYNAKPDTKPYAVFMDSGIFKDSRLTAPSIGRTQCSPIDHIFHTADATPIYYTTIYDGDVMNASDHRPVFADFKISSKYKGEDKKELTTGSDLRIMSFNILSEEWAANATLAPRISGVTDCIRYYNPDIIGIQEVSAAWYPKLKEILGDTYELINVNILNGKNNNYTALAYNKNTVKLIESDLYFYTVGNSQRLRLINAGVFELKISGQKLVVTNTHFNANHKGAEIETQNRLIQASEFIAKIKEYKDKYNCPVISTGDYNCDESTTPYASIMDSGIFQEAKHSAAVKGTIVKTYHDLGKMPANEVNSIDHIFYTEGVDALYYTTIIDDAVIRSSDHNPIFADFKFVSNYEGKDKQELTENAEFRVMSFNILSEEWAADATLQPRILGVTDCIEYYNPDIIGIQEVSKAWHPVLRALLGDTYEFINADILGDKDNCYTMLAYNKNTVNFIESDLYLYQAGSWQRLRLINAGLFELKSSGKKLVVTSTHLSAGGDAATPERLLQANEFITKIKEYKAKYNCPIISTGDYNCDESTTPYAAIMDSGIYKEAKHSAAVKGTIVKTYHNLGEMPANEVNSIDHIFYTDGVDALYHTTIIDDAAIKSSDHNPIFADFKFSK